MLDDGADVEYIQAGKKPVQDLYNGKLNFRAVKMYADGSLGARSAWMLAPYTDDPSTSGQARYTNPEFFDHSLRIAEEGFQIGTHAIGDAAVHQVIIQQKKVIDQLGLKNPRFRIEHDQIIAPEDIPSQIKDGFIASMQPTHATSDMNMALDRIGSKRIKSAYAWRTIIDDGGIIASGSDAPVERLNPWEGFYAAVSRKARNSSQQPAAWPNGWYPDQKMTRKEALKSFTIWGAYASFSENTKGSLEPGKYADFVVIDRDYMTCPEDEIKDIHALTTVIGGEVVYQK
jgi:predicted amidohydrolase YtcJ